MKKISILILSTLIVGLLLTSCTGITKSESAIKNEPVTTISYPVTPFEGSIQDGILIVGYNDKNLAMEKLTGIFGKLTIRADIPQLDAFSVNISCSVDQAITMIKKLESEDKEFASSLKYVEPSYKRDLIRPFDKSSIIKDAPGGFTTEYATTTRLTDPHRLWGIYKINADKAWTNSADGENVKVAVVDTGIDGSHPDLSDNFLGGYAPYSDTVLATNTDHSQNAETHATHVMGTIAALNNSIGVTGVAPKAKVMNIRIFDKDADPAHSSGAFVGDDFVAKGIVWAVDHGAEVLSNSWGGKGYSYLLHSAINYALAHNSIFVASAGNDTTDEIHYPSCYPGVINIAASNATDGITSFSTRGEWVTVSAPGEKILSTVPIWDGAYGYMDGTSMATPHVSGAVAALISKIKKASKTYTPYQIRQMLINSAVDICKPGFDNDSGWGRIDLEAAAKINVDTMPKGATVKYIVKGERAVSVSETSQYPNGFPLTGAYITLKPLTANSPVLYGKTAFDKTASTTYVTFSEVVPGDYTMILSSGSMNGFVSMTGVLAQSYKKSTETLGANTNTTVTKTLKSSPTVTVNSSSPSVSSNFKLTYTDGPIDVSGTTLVFDDTYKAGFYDIYLTTPSPAATDTTFNVSITYPGLALSDTFNVSLTMGSTISVNPLAVYIY